MSAARGAAASLIVFSHLRWDFVTQRPQQLLARLALDHPVWFVEEPVFEPCVPVLRSWQPVPGVTVCRPHTPVQSAGFHDQQLPHLRAMVHQLAQRAGPHIAWFYTPMALPLLQELAPLAVVYDCMDELANFRGAPRQLSQRESALLKVADVVFTGGGSLYRARLHRHHNIHCFPSSVDAAHFRNPAITDHPLQAPLPRPRLGYYGVLDERIDFALLDQMALARPEWQIVLVGPTAKIDPDQLPRRPNLIYTGRQPYRDLPAFLAGWDVCLLPFAQNAATRFLSPTKLLEYMTRGVPIVSTPVADVEQGYDEVVAIAGHPLAFIDACEQALAAPPAEQARRAARMRTIVDATSWNDTAAAMKHLIEAAVGQRQNPAGAALRHRAAQDQGTVQTASTARFAAAPAAGVDTLIIGAGPTGLAAAWHLPRDTLVLDKNATVGGWCRSLEDHGFTFDYAGHIMFSTDPWVLDMYRILLGANIHWQDREAWVYSHGVHTRYPFQGALYGLPPQVLKECLIGAIEARFGPLRGPAANAPRARAAAGKPAIVAPLTGGPPRNFEEFIHKTWGAGVARHFALPYNRKLWTVPLADIETSWLGDRVPLPDLEQMIEGALEPVARPMGPNARFAYPLRGGFQALMNGFAGHIAGRVECHAEVVHIDPQQRLVQLADGRRFRYRQLISTMPLPELVRVLGDAAPPTMREAAVALRHVSIRCVNLGVARANLTDKHWIYYPGDEIFHRIFVQGNASPHNNPPGGFGLTCEISHGPDKPLPCEGQALIERCVADCVRVGLLRPDDRLITANQVDMPYAYVVYDHARAANVERLRTWLAGLDILLAGRYAEWEYYNSDHAFCAGRRAAEAVKSLKLGKASGGARPASAGDAA